MAWGDGDINKKCIPDVFVAESRYILLIKFGYAPGYAPCMLTLNGNMVCPTTRDKINMKLNSILEERMLERCTIFVDGMAHIMGSKS